MGSNTLTNLIPNMYSALDVVSRELVGYIPAVTRDPTTDRAAKNQTVYSFVAPAVTASDITPGVTPPDDGDQTFGTKSMVITKVRRVPFRWNGEDTRAVNNGGPTTQSMQAQQLQQALRTLVNEMETDLAVAAALGASRAEGTPGTAPFGSDLSDMANVRKILADNGAPQSDLHLILDTTSGAKMRSLPNLTRVSEAGDNILLRQGLLGQLQGFDIRESAKVQRPASGTGTSYTTSTAGFAVGATTIAVITGTGTILAGDVVQFAGDSNQYNVATALTGGNIVLQAPGLLQAIPASATAVTVNAIGARNTAFARSALVLATRLPALPDGGDVALDRTSIVDPVSGIAFELAMYAQYRQMQYEVSAAWGATAVKNEHIAIAYGK